MRRPLGLRAALTALFALGGVLLATVMALGTYTVARGYLLDQRERSAMRQAYADASYVRDGLLTSGRGVSDVLGAASPPAQSTVLVQRRDRWYSSSLDVGQDAVPTSLRDEIEAGNVAVQWGSVRGAPSIMVGIPLPAVNSVFYELSATTELDRTLTTLRAVLLAFALAVIAAAALLGRWAARRVVAPLDAVAGTAARIAGGELDTRLPPTSDPDLATFVGSFNTMVDTVAERIARDARFTADVSHELRSPLTALVTSVDVLEGRRSELSARSAKVLDLVRADLRRFQAVLEDLLELGRLDAGVSPQRSVGVDAGELVRHTLAETGRDPGLVVTDLRLPALDVDKQRLSRALRNLFDNADLHGAGLSAVAVRSAGEPSSPFVLITVDDNGPGVPPEDRERIFERFARGGSRGSRPGAGLGLSIVAETVRSLGGDVWCAESEGGGARFFVRIPAAAGSDGGPM